MSTSKTLTLKNPLTFIQQERLSQVIGHIKDPSKQENFNTKNKKSTDIGKEKKVDTDEKARKLLQQKALQERIHWLCETYPHCFNQEDPKPLSIGMFNDILLEGLWPYSKTLLRKTLRAYTRSSLYQKAIIQVSKRHFLNGSIAQEITVFEKENAEKHLGFLKKRQKTKK